MGDATFLDANTVSINDQLLEAENIIIATGSHPVFPKDLKGTEHCVSSDEIFDNTTVREFPKQVTIVGGGYIACEFANIFYGLGSKVNLVHRGDLVLRSFDKDLRKSVTKLLQDQVDVHLNTEPTLVTLDNDKKVVTLSNGKKLSSDLVLLATGRKPSTETLNLDKIGVETNDKSGAIKVNEYCQTNLKHIYAIGDIIDAINLTPVATYQGQTVCENIYKRKGKNQQTINLKNVPSSVFTSPPVGTVGLTEEEATKKYGKEFDVYESSFTPLKHTVSKVPKKSMMKLIVEKKEERVVGCHMFGEDSPEIIQGFAVAVKAGLTKQDFDATIGIHPTAAEEFVTMRKKRS